MPAAESIKEYLIGLGFNLDIQGFKRFNHILAETGEGFIALGERSLAVASAVGLAVERVASNYEDFYYLSQRTGSTVQALQATAYGFTQIGLNAGDAKSMVDGLAMALRTNPGNGALLQLLGVGPGNANDQALKLVENLSHMPFYIASQYASMLGISPQQLLMMEQNLPKLEAARADHIKRMKEAGIDPDKFAGKSNQFMTDLRRLEDEFFVVASVIGDDFIRPVDWAVNEMEALTEWFTKADKATNHWMSTVGALVGSLGALAAMKKSLGWLLGLFGVKGAEAAAATAGGGTGAGGATAAIAAGGMSGALVGGLAGLSALKHDSETGNTFRSWLRNKLGIADPHEAAPWQSGGAWSHGSTASMAEREAYIRERARVYGIDPDIAVAVAKSEGLNRLAMSGSPSANDYGTSAGDFQLHYGGSGIPGMNAFGLGDEFTRKTGLDARDPANWRAADDFALRRAAKLGWGPWHGAARIGITGREGIGVSAPLGADTASAKGDVNLNQNTTITVHGSDDPKTTADHVLKGQQNVNADLVRNAGTTVR